jgi:hypothetical protein
MDIHTNERLREILRQSGLTNEAMARAVNRVAAEHGEILRSNKSSISHWVNGVTPQARTIGYLCEALSRRLARRVDPADLGFSTGGGNLDALPDDPVNALARLGRADVDRRSMLTGAVYSLGALLLPIAYQSGNRDRVARAESGSIGFADVEVVTDITEAFTRADERLGGGFGRTAVVEYLTTDVAAFCRARAPEPVRLAMLGAASQLAYLAGWKAHDIGREELAQRYYLHAYQLAMDAGDLGQAAFAMRILAYQAFDIGHSDHCVDLADAAVRTGKGRVDPHTQTLLTLTLAKAHGMTGDRRRALTAIGEAETLMSRVRPGDERPAWTTMHGYSPAQFHNHVAKTLMDLGDFRGAQEHFSRSVKDYLDPVRKTRIFGLTHAWLAEAQCRQGQVEQACQTWSEAIRWMQGVQSTRTRDAVRTMKRMLSPYRRRGIPGVARLLRSQSNHATS